MWTRRAFLGGLGAAGALALADSVSPVRAALSLPRAPPPAGGVLREFELMAAEHRGGVIAKASGHAPFWLYNDTIFQTLRVKRGDTVRAHLKNRLPEHTSIHWHGIRVPNLMDGVQYLTQPPVEPGQDFTYEFTPPDTGTFFFHSHCNGASQIGRGLAGILIVEGDEPEKFDAEYILALKDWRLAENGEWLPFFTEEGAGRAGTFGTVRTVNGEENFTQKVLPGQDIRIRVLNLDPTRMIDLGVEGAEAFVIATDGNPVEPFPLNTWRMGAAMRADIQVRTPKSGQSFTVRDYFSAKPWALASFTSEGADVPDHAFTARPLYAPHIPKPDLASAERVKFQFSAAAGATASIDTGIPDGNPLAKELMDSLCTGQRGFWAINKAQWPTGGHRALPPPLALLETGKTYVFELMNGTPHPHPIHMHGHTFEVMSASRQDLPRFLADTVIVQPKERIEIAFVAAKGDWMFHCHILEHQENGMMGWLESRVMKKFVYAAAFVAAASGALAGGEDLSRAIGKALFERAWVPAPSSTLANDGLGPLFNARACSACHVSLDRAAPVLDGRGGFSHQGMVLKLSDAAGHPDPVYGVQMQTAAIPGFSPEGRLVMTDAGAAAKDLASGGLAAGTRNGLRAAPALRGLGKLAEISDAAILANEDADDGNNDGISGRANWLVDAKGEKRLGRFGLKASGATLSEQVETAFAMDLGMSTSGRPAGEGDCLTDICRRAPHGGTAEDPEIRHDLVAMISDYLAAVPPPQPVALDADGARLFAATGCASCHIPSLPGTKGEVPAHSDLLLHDLGAGLDGGATEPGVAATEWRTAPLWGLARALTAKAGLLHDGRAPGVPEAVALHGGEGAQARSRFSALSGPDRAALLRYVEGL